MLFMRRIQQAAIKKKNLAVFVSDGGSNFQSIHDACVGGSIHGDIVILVANKHGGGGAEYARDKGIPTILFPKSKHEANGLSPTDLVAALRFWLFYQKKFGVDFILLAGYLKPLPNGVDPSLSKIHIKYPSFISSSIWWQRLL